MDANNITETEALQMAIDHFQQQAPRNCGVMYEQYTAVAEWLQELAAFKDETPITEKWLYHNFPLCANYCHFFNGDDFYLKINRTIGEIHFVEVENKIDGKDYHHECVIKTIGQFKMFLTLCGQGDFANQLKN